MLSKEEMITRLESEVEVLLNKLTQAEQVIKAKTLLVSRFENDVKDCNYTIKELNASIDMLSSANKMLKAELSELLDWKKKNAGNGKDGLAAVESENVEQVEDEMVLDNQSLIKSLRLELKSKEQDIETITRRLTDKHTLDSSEMLTQLQSQERSFEIEKKELVNALENLKKHTDCVEMEMEKLKSLYQAQATNVLQQETRIKTLVVEIEDQIQMLKHKSSLVEELETKLDALREEKCKLQDEMANLQQYKQHAELEHKKLKEEHECRLHGLELELESVQSSKQVHITRLEEVERVYLETSNEVEQLRIQLQKSTKVCQFPGHDKLTFDPLIAYYPPKYSREMNFICSFQGRKALLSSSKRSWVRKRSYWKGRN